MADLVFNFWDSAALLMFNVQQISLFGQIYTSQTGGQPYNDPSHYGDRSLINQSVP